MGRPLPIIESRNEEFQFLHGSPAGDGSTYVDSRSEPFPPEENLIRLIELMRLQRRDSETQTLARVESNLGAVRAVLGRTNDALDSLRGAQETYQEILGHRDGWTYRQAVIGIAVTHYNAAVVFANIGDFETAMGQISESERQLKVMPPVGPDYPEKVAFLSDALSNFRDLLTRNPLGRPSS